MEELVLKKIWDPNEENIFWFERNLDKYIILDNNYYYCFDVFYLDKVYNHEISKAKLNFLKDFTKFKKLIFYFFKTSPKKKIDISSLLERYLREKIKMNRSLLHEITKQNSESEVINEFLLFIIEKYFEHEK